MLADYLWKAVENWPLLLTLGITTYLLRNKYGKGINKYPGPWLAAYTNWWRVLDASRRSPERTHIQLHRKLGDIVRLGPNVLSFADPKAIKEIYGLNKGFIKSDFYIVQNGISKGQRLQSLFSTVDENYHARYRRCVNNAFAMSSLVSYEPLVDSTTKLFLDRTQQLYAETGGSCNFGRWLQFYAFDVIGELTWSKRLGFLERNEDVDGIVEFLGQILSYAAVIGQMPILDLLLHKNPIKMWLQRVGLSETFFPITSFAVSRNSERASDISRIRETGKADPNPRTGGVDLLSKFAQAAHDHPEFMDDTRVLTSTVSMVFAGSDTTGISLSSIFYHLLKHPHVYQKLMAELDDAVKDGIVEDRPEKTVSWSESQKLPYLDAVIQESLRLHPAAGLPLERIVPPGGMTIMGEHIPGGTIVGCNAWVLHRRPEVFGDDVDVFRPERWIEAPSEQLRTMKATMFQFGAGARTCIGKNISLLEMYKLVPSFLRRFKIELADPNKSWKTKNQWFVKQQDFVAKFTTR